jgi:hypothetical protein
MVHIYPQVISSIFHLKLQLMFANVVFLVHPQNGLNGLILNWCTSGCWFTPAQAKGKLRDGNRTIAFAEWEFHFSRLCISFERSM